MRLVQIKNKAAPSESIPEMPIRTGKLIISQLGAYAIYIYRASYIRSVTIKIMPLNYNRSNLSSLKDWDGEC